MSAPGAVSATAPWTSFVADGQGQLEFRLMIEGWPYEFVTSKDMETATRIRGLDRAGLSLSEKAMPHLAELDVGGITARIVERQHDDKITAALFTQSTKTTWIDADVTTAGTTFSVLDVAGWSNGDVFHIGTEAVTIGTVGASSFTGCTRGSLNTIAQAHYAFDATLNLGAARVTDQPQGLEGRRAYLYAYAEGDDLTASDGTLIWRMVCATDARLTDDGSSWEITLDPITRLLEQEMGSDLGSTIVPRGAYYPKYAGLMIHVGEETTATRTLSTYGERVFIYGHFERNQDLVDEINTQLATMVASQSLTGTYNAIAYGDYGWGIQVTTASSSPKFPYVGWYSVVDGSGGCAGPDAVAEPGIGLAPTLAPVITVSASTTYDCLVVDHVEGSRTIPRGYLQPSQRPGLVGPVDRDPQSPTNGTYWDARRVYLRGPTSVSGLAGATAEVTRDGDTVAVPIDTADATSRSITFTTVGSADGEDDLHGPYTSMLPLEIEATIALATNGDLNDVRSYLTANSPTECNRGRLPLLTNAELDSWATIVAANSIEPFTSNRDFYVTDAVTLSEYITHECRLLGVFPAIDSDGKITLRSLDIPISTDRFVASITASEYLIDDGFATWERNAWGSLNAIVINDDYDPLEDEYGSQYVIRDAATYSARKAPKQLEISPKSRVSPTMLAYGSSAETRLLVADIGSRALGLFGHDYAVITAGVALKHFNVMVGDKVLLTMGHIPDGAGGRGVTDQPAIVVGRRWDMDQGRGQMDFLIQYENVCGYTPSVRITAESVAATNLWTLTVDSSDPASSVWQMFPDGHDLSDHFAVGDAVRAIQFDTASPTIQTGAVTSVTDSVTASGITPASGTIIVQFDGAVSLSSSTWWLTYSDAASATTGQQSYCYFGDAAATIGFSTEVTAKVYG